MSRYNIERNKLDYLLTDIMPVEVSELFTYSKFYEFLISKQPILDEIVTEVRVKKSQNKSVLFCSDGRWATAPLKYNVLKGTDSLRELNLVQPLSALNIYLFVECYQKEILSYLSDNSVFSLRYHRKNPNLYYKGKVNRVTHYFEKVAHKVDRAILQQTGAYFNIYKYNSLSSFVNSRLWRMSNFQYKHFAKADYKSCFGSIYTHAFKWIIEKNVVDSKNANNTNLFIVIDRLLQNINGYSSNGLIVGPEFSRMMAELLLQTIDIDVKEELEKQELKLSRDYRVFRYVDDLFIFANTQEDVEQIIQAYSLKAQRYLLYLNESKYQKCQTPVILSSWLSETRQLSDRIGDLFHKPHEIHEMDGEKFVVKPGFVPVDRLKDDFTCLVCKYPEYKRYIVSFILSTLLNNLNLKKDGYTLFEQGHTSKAYVLLELCMHVLSYCPCFEHCQKVISILVYMDDELCFKKSEDSKKGIQALVNRYAFIFENGNINDLCNWFVVFYEFKLVLPKKCEEKFENQLFQEDNPILWANYLIYSQYYLPYFNDVLESLERVINVRIDTLTKREMMAQREFWYIIIFNNCPYLSPSMKSKIDKIVDDIRIASPSTYYEQLRNLLYDFIKQSSSNQFFLWGYHKFSTSKQITYRTYKRTMFKQYRRKRNVELYGSLDT